MKRGTGILWVILVFGAALLVAACSGDGGMVNSDMGRVRISMSSATSGTAASQDGSIAADTLSGGQDTDASPKLQEANVTFSSILARNLDGQLIDVTIDLPVTVDLLSLASNRSINLPIGFLPPGTYDQLVVVMTQLELVTLNGTQIAITPPGGGWTKVVRTGEFTVVEGEETAVMLRFWPHRSFTEDGGGFHFHPEFDCQH